MRDCSIIGGPIPSGVFALIPMESREVGDFCDAGADRSGVGSDLGSGQNQSGVEIHNFVARCAHALQRFF